MGFYIRTKGCKERGHQEKALEEVYFTVSQVQAVLRKIEESAPDNPRWERDHGMVFMGFFFGLRIGEVCLLTRTAFRNVSKGMAYIHTLKMRGRHIAKNGLPEEVPPVVEKHVREYVVAYLKKIPKDQEYLFVSRRGSKLSEQFVSQMFQTYIARAGMSQAYSWHGLRHGRGVQLWEKFKDLKLVQLMLRHSCIESTQVYVGMSPSTLQVYSAKLDEDRLEG
jgi:site-specific recombinase XerD